MILWLLALLRLFLFEDEGTGDGDENEDPPADEDEEETDETDRKGFHDPVKKKLSEEAKKWRLKLREAEAKLKDIEDAREALRTARLELAFLRTTIEHDDPISDLETAWDLGTARGYFDTVKIEDDGTVAGMDEALGRLLERYPYLIDVDDEEEPEPRPSLPSPRPIGQGRKAGVTVTEATLEQRFPLLKKRRR